MQPIPLCRSERADARRSNVLNADNESYQPRVDCEGDLYGELDELNGEGAREKHRSGLRATS